MAIDLRQLKALTAVIEEGTFTDAGIALGTSQASISRAISGLEAIVGVRLLQRTSEGALPTATGRRVAEHARRILVEVAAIEHLADETADRLRVGFTWSLFGGRTVAVQRRWRAAHPGRTLTFVQAEPASAGLLEGEVDVAVWRRELNDPRFERSLVGSGRRMVGLAADDPLARRRSVRLADLADRVIAVSTTTGTTTTELWPVEHRPATREIRGIEEWLTVIASGEAVGVTPEATAQQFPRPGVRYRRISDAPPIGVWLAWWRDQPPAEIAAFRELVCEVYASR